MSTELTIQASNTRALYREFVRDGVAGNYDVIGEMRRLIRESVDYDKGVEKVAKGILINSGLDSFATVTDQLAVIVAFVGKRVKYVQDIAGRIESLKSARVTLSDGYGDCDDQTVLNATLAGDLGFEDVRIAMARYSPNDDAFGHVYCVVYHNGKRFVLDTSLPNPKLNQEVKPFEVKEIPVFTDVKGYDGFSGAIRHVKYHGKKFAQLGAKIIPNAVYLLPVGFLSANAIATGTGLMERASGKPLSLSATASGINQNLDRVINDLCNSKIAYDLAKSEALQIAAQIAAVDITADDKYTLKVARESIKEKLDFIRNFPAYAEANNIKIVYLNSSLMMYAGFGLAGVAGYALYKNYKSNRG